MENIFCNAMSSKIIIHTFSFYIRQRGPKYSHPHAGAQTRRNSSPKMSKSKSKSKSEWVVLDITAFTKTTDRDKVLKILKAGGMTVCKVTDPYDSNTRNKSAISITVKRADFETKTPDYPGQNFRKSSSL